MKKLIDNAVEQRFNNLTIYQVSSIKSTSEHGRVLFDCRCDCGQLKLGVRIGDLRRGLIKSCGCMSRGKNSHSWCGYKDIPRRYWTSIVSSAKRRKIQFDIPIKYGWELFLEQDRRCALTGELLGFGSIARNRDITASLDRINSSEGYKIGNVQWVHKDINIMKWDLTNEEFLNKCEMVVKHRLSRKIHNI